MTANASALDGMAHVEFYAGPDLIGMSYGQAARALKAPEEEIEARIEQLQTQLKEAKKKGEPQVINFEDDTITGDLSKPDGEYVEARRKVSHSNLIRVRENWRDKVMQASGEL